MSDNNYLMDRPEWIPDFDQILPFDKAVDFAMAYFRFPTRGAAEEFVAISRGDFDSDVVPRPRRGKASRKEVDE